jgi:hypothetical protein
MRKLINNDKESAQIVKLLEERPYTLKDLTRATGKSFAAMRTLIDTLSFNYLITQDGKKYFIPKYDLPQYVKELADEYKLLEYNEHTGKYEIIGKKIDFVRFYIRKEYQRLERLVPYKEFCKTMQYIGGFSGGFLKRLYYIVINER